MSTFGGICPKVALWVKGKDVAARRWAAIDANSIRNTKY